MRKEGRRHAHAVWSRIDADKMKAINLPHYKNRLNALSKELYLENGWELPNGHRENGWANPLNFTLAEWQQAKRLDLDPREIKQLFQDAWRSSDNKQGFEGALGERGYFLAKGDQRGFVAVDLHGEVYSVSRFTGVKPKELAERLGHPDQFQSVDEAKLEVRQRVDKRVHQFLVEARADLREQQRPLLEEHKAMVEAHRAEIEKLKLMQAERHARENRERQSRIRTGIRGLLDFVIGRAANIRRINDREAMECGLRDADQREAVSSAMREERRELQTRIDAMRRGQRSKLMSLARAIGRNLRGLPPLSQQRAQEREQEKPTPTLKPRTRGRDFMISIRGPTCQGRQKTLSSLVRKNSTFDTSNDKVL